MKKKVLVLVLVLAFAFSAAAQAAGPVRIIRTIPSISFNGTTVACKATVRANSESDQVFVVVKLWSSGVCKGTWTGSGAGYAEASGSRTATNGATYTLKVDATINGVAQPTKSVTRTCP